MWSLAFLCSEGCYAIQTKIYRDLDELDVDVVIGCVVRADGGTADGGGCVGEKDRGAFGAADSG